jgi:hypothetical protein
MKKFTNIILLIVLSHLAFHQTVAQWRPLFNDKNLDGWDTYLGPAYDSVKKTFDTTRVLGLNNDPDKIFSAVKVDGRPAIRISGEHFGGISTKESFANYHLKLEFKWGQKKSNPRKDRVRDSGILYHAVGKHGADFGFWMRSQEFQVEEGNVGDYWGVAGGSFEVQATLYDKKYVYDPRGQLFTFNEKSKVGRNCVKSEDAEKPSGQWNSVEIYCLGDTAVHVINGRVNMILFHSAQLDKGTLNRLSSGKIQIQSEGAEVFYRNIQIEKIKKLPEEILKMR